MVFGDLVLGPAFGNDKLVRAVLGDAPLDLVAMAGLRDVPSGYLSGHIEDADATAQVYVARQISAEAAERLDWVMVVMGMVAAPIKTDRGRVVAYVPKSTPRAVTPIDPGILAEAMGEIVACKGRICAARCFERLEQILVRAASRARALETEQTPTIATAPRVSQTRHPYMNYFTLVEQDIAFPRFDGTFSDRVTRAAFVSGDAVTVLPYDPPRDRVLVIEQFRFGPWLRGAQNPWSIEAIAGRIDASETPEQAGRREAVEEAGLTLGRFHSVGNYYPSPGAVTEYLYSYVAEADLPDGCDGLGGQEAEHEDIRSMLWSFDELMDAVRTGRLDNGPALVSALWLQVHRDRLQAGA